MSVKKVQKGRPVKFDASEENKIRGFVNRLMDSGGEAPGQFGESGRQSVPSFAAPHAIFEITYSCNGGACYVVWDPDDENAPTPPGEADGFVPDVPYSLGAKRVWVNPQTGGYGETDASDEEIAIYFPLATKINHVGGYRDLDRVPAWWDKQSGRWWSINREGEIGSSSSGEGEDSSSSEPVYYPPAPWPCAGYTGALIVGTGQLTRNGDYIEETRVELDFEQGILCEIVPVEPGSCYLCCPDDSSSGEPGPPT